MGDRPLTPALSRVRREGGHNSVASPDVDRSLATLAACGEVKPYFGGIPRLLAFAAASGQRERARPGLRSGNPLGGRIPPSPHAARRPG